MSKKGLLSYIRDGCAKRTGAEGSMCDCGKNHTFTEEFVIQKAVEWVKDIEGKPINEICAIVGMGEDSEIKPEHFTALLKKFIGLTEEDFK